MVINPTVMVLLVASFWIASSFSLWWQERSWFPFTVVAPLILLSLAMITDKFMPGLGTTAIALLHVALWGVYGYVKVDDMMRSKK